jgi:predicted phosphodiesterase
LRPSAERARRDEQVGSAEAEGVRVDVAGGHAVVRELEQSRVLLWASAPRLSVSLGWSAPVPGEVLVEVQTCMPRAALEATPSVPLLASERDATGRCSFRLELPADVPSVQLEIAPPDTLSPSPFRFAVMSDVQEAIGDVQDIYAVMNREPGLDFLLGAGDLTEQGTHQQLQRFERELRQLGIPYYTTLGKHELGQSPSLYQDYFGRGSQSFVYRGVRFTLLDSASATLAPKVYNWLDDWLRQGQNQVHIVAMHIPPLDPSGTRHGAFASKDEAAKLLNKLMLGGVDLTLYGHIHTYVRFENAGIPAYIVAGGGALPVRGDGIGRHYAVTEVSAEQGVVATHRVEVDGDWDY